MSSKLRPVGNKILVRPDAPDAKSKGGIILPETAQVKPERGTVLAVGEGRLSRDGSLIPNNVKAGDKILWAVYQGGDVKVDGERLVIVGMEDVWGVFDE